MTRKAAIKQQRRELIFDVKQAETCFLKRDFIKAELFLKLIKRNKREIERLAKGK